MEAKELYRRCREREEAAWGYVYRYALQVARSGAASLEGIGPEDVAQEVVLSLMEGGLDSVQEPAAFKGFIRQATAHRVIDYHRAARRRSTLPLDPPAEGGDEPSAAPQLASQGPSPEEALMVRDRLVLCKEIIRSLDARCREVLPPYFQLRALGLKIREIAQRLNRPEGTLSSLVHRCLMKLRRHPRAKELL
ncbi:MAG: RNA polymerase sigma factor [Nitrospinota bacterium]